MRCGKKEKMLCEFCGADIDAYDNQLGKGEHYLSCIKPRLKQDKPVVLDSGALQGGLTE
jgi:hypothetical protein